MKKQLFTTFLMVALAISASAQVTIGDGEEPLPVSVLELISPSGNRSGLRLPQLTTNDISILEEQIAALTGDDKARAKGLMVYNTDTNCVHVWNGTEFKSICGDMGKAEVIVDCTNIKVYPDVGKPAPELIPDKCYREGISLNSDHYITVPVTCTKAGTYTISVSTGNGYSFFADGTYLEVGDYTIKLEGQGAPQVGSPSTNPNSYWDDLSLKFNDEAITSCAEDLRERIVVYPAEAAASFEAIDCKQDITVNGTYVPGTELTGSNTLVLKLTNVTQGAYSFQATGNGMTFSRTGTFTAGATEATIVLTGSGKPTNPGVTTLALVNNYDKTNPIQLCTGISIIVAYPAMKIMGLGGGIYQPASALTTENSRRFIQSANNFGILPTSTVASQGFTLFDGGYSVDATLAYYINNQKPDIIIISYAYASVSTATLDALTNFVNNGGVIIAGCQNELQYRLARRIWGNSNMYAADYGDIYYHPFVAPADFSTYNIAADDPVYYGPFSGANGLEGRAWGEDVVDGWSFTPNNFPSDAIVYSAQTVSGVTYLSAIRHPSKGFFVIGDAGWLAGNATDTSTTIYPFALDSNYRPRGKTYTGGTVYNSEFFGNVMAWAIDYVYKNKQ